MQTNHQSMIHEFPSLVVNNLRDNIRMEGVHQLTRDELRELLKSTLESHLNERSQHQEDQQQNVQQRRGLANLPTNDDSGYGIWWWGGRLRRLYPESYQFPKANVKSILDLFVFGIPNQNIRPFRLFDAGSVREIEKPYFCKSNFIYQYMIDVARTHNFIASTNDSIANITRNEWDHVFAKSFAVVLKEIEYCRGKAVSRSGEISYVTFYDYLKDLRDKCYA